MKIGTFRFHSREFQSLVTHSRSDRLKYGPPNVINVNLLADKEPAKEMTRPGLCSIIDSTFASFGFYREVKCYHFGGR